MASDIITSTFEPALAAVRGRIDEILHACRVKDFDRLASYHLSGPKFSKFDDEGPQGRQDDVSGMQGEIDAFQPLEDFEGTFHGLKIDVFGPVAIATGVFRATFAVSGEKGSAQSRSTVVFVDSGEKWLIA